MKKIIMFTGGVETLSYFARQLGNEFIRQGYAVFYYNLKNQQDSTKKVKRFIKQGETILITFNFQGLSKEEGVYNQSRGYIWSEYRLPCYNIAVDHPYYYDKQLCDLPKSYVHISIDRLHEKYFKEYYPEFKNGGFLPLGGKNLYESQSVLGLGERTIDVLFPGNYTPPEFCDTYIHGINEEYAAFYQGIIDELILMPEKTVEEVAIEHVRAELGNVDVEDMRKILNKMIFVDLYVRNYMRGKVVRTLAEGGIRVKVIGKDWEKLKCSAKDNIEIVQFSDSEVCMREMGKSKIVVNVMPWFKDGAHDRVFNAVLNGAVSVSDESKYQMEALKEGAGVNYYSLRDIDILPEKIKELLKDENKLQKISERGYKIAISAHTWAHRTKELLKIIEL